LAGTLLPPSQGFQYYFQWQTSPGTASPSVFAYNSTSKTWAAANGITVTAAGGAYLNAEFSVPISQLTLLGANPTLTVIESVYTNVGAGVAQYDWIEDTTNSWAITGTAETALAGGGTAVTGSSTLFTTQLDVGERIFFEVDDPAPSTPPMPSHFQLVTAITDATHLTLAAPGETETGGQAFSPVDFVETAFGASPTSCLYPSQQSIP
jgi:hypothetical protein